MSRSKKKTMTGSIIKISSSEKKDKQLWHRAFRRKNKIISDSQIKNNNEEFIFPKIEEISDPWRMTKDGKILYYTELDIRKNIDSLFKQIEQNIDINNNWSNWAWIIKDMCKYFDINEKEELLKIADKKINQFIEYFINREKSK